jgi:hypothetical protein
VFALAAMLGFAFSCTSTYDPTYFLTGTEEQAAEVLEVLP